MATSTSVEPAGERPATDAGPAAGYVDPGEAAGRAAGEYFYWVVLAVTAGADLAIFHQVLALVLQGLSGWELWLAVAGFTACSLLLAHLAGRLLRDRKAAWGPSSRILVAAVAAAWVLLGAAAFTVRLVIPENTADDPTAVTAVDGETRMVVGAVLFLLLYVGSGVVSGTGAYLSRHPLRERYRKALRDYRAAEKRLRRTRPPYERTVSTLQLHLRNRHQEETNYQAARQHLLGLIAEMTARTELLIAGHLQAPSATTGVSTPRRRLNSAPPSSSEPEDRVS